MTDDLISRKAAIEGVLELDVRHRVWWGDAVIDMLDALPTVDSTDRKVGEWMYVKKRLARGGYVDASECSVCHKRIMPHLEPNFCPNCGARMDGGEDG